MVESVDGTYKKERDKTPPANWSWHRRGGNRIAATSSANAWWKLRISGSSLISLSGSGAYGLRMDDPYETSG
ncbi:hypothetical protein GCM10025779_00830 [Arthrobacter cryoconiti]